MKTLFTALVVAHLLAADFAAGAFFKPIPILDSSYRTSADGNYVLGGKGGDVYRWSEETGPAKLYSFASATGLSIDGSITGTNFGLEGDGVGFVIKGAPGQPGFSFETGGSRLTGISDDGTHIIGDKGVWARDFSSFTRLQPANEIADLWDISSDGSVVVGSGRANFNDFDLTDSLMVWSNMVDISPQTGFGSARIANAAISPDGRFVVGAERNADVRSSLISGTFIYDVSTGQRTNFPVSESGHLFYPTGVSNSRRVIGIYATPSDLANGNRSNSKAAIWDGEGAPSDLTEFFQNQPGTNALLSGWTLTAGADISADGRTIVGSGINPQGQRQAWIADCTSCNDILRNSVLPEVVGEHRDTVRATFTPNFGMSLEEAEEHCGVKSFNWIQTIELLPVGMKMWELPIGTIHRDPAIEVRDGTPFNLEVEVPGIRQGLPVLDPVDNSGRVQVVTGGSLEALGYTHLVVDHPGTDDKPYYWNEGKGNDRLHDISYYTYTHSLRFEDLPTLPLTFASGESVHFRTSLVGIREDGSYITWENIGTNFTWESDRTHDGLAAQVNNIDYAFFSTLASDAPAWTSGGVFNVQLDTFSVPESPSHVMAIFAAIVGLTSGHARLRSSHKFLTRV